jgi:hypothetical protein
VNIDSYGNRIKGVFYIAVSNFVSPSTPSYYERANKQVSDSYGIVAVVIDFTMLLFISIESLDFINILYLTPVNVYMTIFGVVFATGALVTTSLHEACPELTCGQCGVLQTRMPRL